MAPPNAPPPRRAAAIRAAQALLLCLCPCLALGPAPLRADSPPAPDLTADLGPADRSDGLTVPSAGDGANEAVVRDGSPARRIVNGSLYLYVRVDHPAYRAGPRDLYLTVDVFDDAPGRVEVQYDRAGPSDDLAARYADAGDVVPLVGSKRWMTLTFALPRLRLGHGQNHGADLRLAGPGLVVRRLTLGARPPAGYDPAHPNRAEALRGLAVTRPPGLELTFGNDATPAQADRFRALSVTSVESYVDWAGVEPEPGRWDWSKWDTQVAILKGAGLKWVPFLIAGPAYATPDWFHRGRQSRYFRCLEHDREGRVQSIFNPDLPARVEAFLTAFAARYRDAGVIESVLLGVTGIYGESIYPAGPEGGWTARLTGPYHNHDGWWAADPDAVAAFRRAMSERYRTIDALNGAWGTSHPGFDAITTFLPERAPSDRARADLAEWYQHAMTRWARLWVETARRVLPSTEIYLCTGGDGLPRLGADFTAQAAAIAPLGAGIRVTNEGSDYASNFVLTREVAAATRLYGTFCGFEPASGVDARGVVGRIYNATASGARQLHDYIPNTLGGDPRALANFRDHAAWLVPRRPRVAVALYLPREAWALDPRGVGRLQDLARVLRDATDVDFLTRRSVEDGHLASYRVLVVSDAPAIEPGAAEAIERWVRAGGVLVAATRPGETLAGRLDDQAGWRGRLFAATGGPVPEGLVSPRLEGDAPARWRLDVGAPGDAPWLAGRWYDPEPAAAGPAAGARADDPAVATMRWSGPEADLLIPAQPGADHEIHLTLTARAEAIGAEGVRLRVGGKTLATLRTPGRSVVRVDLGSSRIGPGGVVRLELRSRGWRPAEVDRGSDDRRRLGVAVHRVEVVRRGTAAGAPGTARLAWHAEPSALAPFRRSVDRGVTYVLPGAAVDPRVVSLVAASLVPGAVDGRLDGLYATETDRGVLWLDPARPSIGATRP